MTVYCFSSVSYPSPIWRDSSGVICSTKLPSVVSAGLKKNPRVLLVGENPTGTRPLTNYPEGIVERQRQGAVVFQTDLNVSYISFWDRSGPDTRSGSCTTFALVPPVADVATALSQINAAFPTLVVSSSRSYTAEDGSTVSNAYLCRSGEFIYDPTSASSKPKSVYELGSESTWGSGITSGVSLTNARFSEIPGRELIYAVRMNFSLNSPYGKTTHVTVTHLPGNTFVTHCYIREALSPFTGVASDSGQGAMSTPIGTGDYFIDIEGEFVSGSQPNFGQVDVSLSLS